MKVRAIDFVVAHVQDVGEAVKFYRETLGISEKLIFRNAEKDTWTEFSTSPVTTAVNANGYDAF